MLAILLSFGAVIGAPAAPAVAAATPCSIGTPVPGDYDGDGGPDLVVGYYLGVTDGNRFQVVPSDGGPRYTLETYPRPTNADLNGDRCSDAVYSRAGTVTLVFGSPQGLDTTTAKTFSLPQASLPKGDEILQTESVVLSHDGLIQLAVAGWVVADDEADYRAQFLDVYTLDAAGDPGTPQVIDLAARGVRTNLALAGSGRSIAIGVGDLTVSGKAGAGGVLLYSASATDHRAMGYRLRLTQNSPRVPGTAEANDGFGTAVSLRDGRLAIGVPFENNSGVEGAGLVQPILWHEGTRTYTAYRAIQQGTRGVVGTNEINDVFGAQVLVTRGLTAKGSYDIAISANETVGKARYAGSVTVANFSRAIYRTYTQNSRGIPGTAETGDSFGSGIGILRTSPKTDTLLIGAAGETVGTAWGVGYVIRSDGRKLSSTTWTAVARPADPAGDHVSMWGSSFAG